jgi:DNA invertase Pin-like site-specific DNA recombinase
MNFIAYYRVSTDKQGRSGLGLEAQQKTVVDYVEGRGDIVASFTEVESGKVNDRPQLADAIAQCRATSSTLIIAKLDRLARKVSFIANLMESEVEFIVADQPHADAFRLHIEAAISEDEGKKISERTRAALAAAKARGVKLGWSNPTRIQEARSAGILGASRGIAKAAKHALAVAPVIAAIKKEGKTTLRAIAAELNTRGITTARGGAWGTSNVRNIMKRKAA